MLILEEDLSEKKVALHESPANFAIRIFRSLDAKRNAFAQSLGGGENCYGLRVAKVRLHSRMRNEECCESQEYVFHCHKKVSCRIYIWLKRYLLLFSYDKILIAKYTAASDKFQ